MPHLHRSIQAFEDFSRIVGFFYLQVRERPSVEDRPLCFEAGIIALAVFFLFISTVYFRELPDSSVFLTLKWIVTTLSSSSRVDIFALRKATGGWNG